MIRLMKDQDSTLRLALETIRVTLLDTLNGTKFITLYLTAALHDVQKAKGVSHETDNITGLNKAIQIISSFSYG